MSSNRRPDTRGPAADLRAAAAIFEDPAEFAEYQALRAQGMAHRAACNRLCEWTWEYTLATSAE